MVSFVPQVLRVGSYDPETLISSGPPLCLPFLLRMFCRPHRIPWAKDTEQPSEQVLMESVQDVPVLHPYFPGLAVMEEDGHGKHIFEYA